MAHLLRAMGGNLVAVRHRIRDARWVGRGWDAPAVQGSLWARRACVAAARGRAAPPPRAQGAAGTPPHPCRPRAPAQAAGRLPRAAAAVRRAARRAAPRATAHRAARAEQGRARCGACGVRLGPACVHPPARPGAAPRGAGVEGCAARAAAGRPAPRTHLPSPCPALLPVQSCARRRSSSSSSSSSSSRAAAAATSSGSSRGRGSSSRRGRASPRTTACWGST
jgi:hypothetical protein